LKGRIGADKLISLASVREKLDAAGSFTAVILKSIRAAVIQAIRSQFTTCCERYLFRLRRQRPVNVAQALAA
jgi:hypothetical protein